MVKVLEKHSKIWVVIHRGNPLDWIDETQADRKLKDFGPAAYFWKKTLETLAK